MCGSLLLHYWTQTLRSLVFILFIDKGGPTLETKKWLNEYFNWLQQGYSVQSLDANDEIITPVTNTIGDKIVLYVTELKKGTLELTDDGETIDNLKLSDFTLTPPRLQRINEIVQSVKVEMTPDKELRITGSPKKFPEMIQNLIQAILYVDFYSWLRSSR